MEKVQHSKARFAVKLAGSDASGRGVVWIHVELLTDRLPISGELFLELREPFDVSAARHVATMLNATIKGVTVGGALTRAEIRSRIKADDSSYICLVCHKRFKKTHGNKDSFVCSRTCRLKARPAAKRDAAYYRDYRQKPQVKLRATPRKRRRPN